MNAVMLRALFVLSLRRPREAAGRIIDLRLSTQVLWLALSLVSVLTSLIFSSLLHAVPLPQDELGQLLVQSPGYESPLLFALLQWGRAVLSVFVLFWVGRALGGRGALAEVLAVITWLQLVTFVLMAGMFVLGFVLPALSSLGMLAVFVWWLWAVVGFLDVAHGFGSALRAFGVLVLSIFGVLVGISLIMLVIAGIAGVA